MTTTRPRSRTAAAAPVARLATALLVAAAIGTGLAGAATASPPSRAPMGGPGLVQPPALVGASGWFVAKPYIAVRGGAAAGGLGDLTTEPQRMELKRKGRIFCSDDDCTWLVNACDSDDNKGGLSTEPDGTVVCTVYDVDD